jgi:hypothetical protein
MASKRLWFLAIQTLVLNLWAQGRLTRILPLNERKTKRDAFVVVGFRKEFPELLAEAPSRFGR